MLARLRQMNSMKRSWPRLCLMACCWRFVYLHSPLMRLTPPFPPFPRNTWRSPELDPSPHGHVRFFLYCPGRSTPTSNYSPRLPLASAVEVEVHILGRHLSLHKLDCLPQQSHVGQTRRPDMPCAMLVTGARIRNDVWPGHAPTVSHLPWSQAWLELARRPCRSNVSRVYKHLLERRNMVLTVGLDAGAACRLGPDIGDCVSAYCTGLVPVCINDPARMDAQG